MQPIAPIVYPVLHIAGIVSCGLALGYSTLAFFLG